MKIKRYSFLFCLMITSLVALASEETPFEKLLKQLAKLTANYPQEKVHLHLDKPYYALGEDIWLKVYIVTAESNEPSLLSGILYIDLINDKSEVKKRIRLAIKKGFASGNITLTDSVTAGNYRLRAYTNYMRNYDQNFFFEKNIQIGDAFNNSIVKPQNSTKGQVEVQFFPEGGELVSDIRSKIGIKAVGPTGMGVNVSGYISNQHNEKVALFNTEHAGMGVFAMVPKTGEKYTATVILPEGGTTKADFPVARESGFVMSVNEIDTNISLKINGSPKMKDGQQLHIVAQNNGLVYGSYSLAFNQEMISINIPKKTFPTGILQFTLFNASLNEPLAERLIFVNHHDQLNIDIRLQDSVTKAMQKVTLDFKVNKEKQSPVVGNFSVAVVDAGQVAFDEDDEISILSNLLLTSDLKGYIEQPNYYFNNPSEDKDRQLNNLMLTQGWRRFVWKDIIENKEPAIKNRIERSIEIRGTVVNLNDKPVEKAKIMLFSSNKDYPMMMETISDANGKFVFDELEFPDSIAIYLQAKTNKDNPNLKIKLDNGPDPKTGVDATAQKKLVLQNNDSVIGDYLQSTKAYFNELDKYNLLDKSIRLRTVNIIGKKDYNPLKSPVVGSDNISGRDHVVGQDVLKNYTNLLDVFYRVPGVMVKMVGNQRMVYRTSQRSTSITGGVKPMVVYLNGSPVTQDILSTINPDDLEGIEVLTSNYNLGIYGTEAASSGALFITLKRGKDVKYPSTNTLTIRKGGLSLTKEFYSPNYDDPKTNKQVADLRSTIYWNPEVNSDRDGKISIKYYNALTPGKYKVIIEGMDAFGNLGRKTYTYMVK